MPAPASAALGVRGGGALRWCWQVRGLVRQHIDSFNYLVEEEMRKIVAAKANEKVCVEGREGLRFEGREGLR